MKIILTGATGMVGEGVLRECLSHDDVEKILVVGRRPCGINHAKIEEVVHKDLSDLSSVENRLAGYDACFFCLGTSSVGMKDEEFYKVTYTLTMNFAGTLSSAAPGMIFCYISGAGTDSSESGKIKWARVKGKTENDLMKLPFKRVYNFRPGYIQPSPGSKNTKKFYRLFMPFYPLLKSLWPKYFGSMKELGTAMINAVKFGYDKQTLEVIDIADLSRK
jgi:uncharacterized protein YbjT (DUF2867 family)